MHPPHHARRTAGAPLLLLLAVLLLITACAPGPVPILWGVDTCARCKMILRDPDFGAEYVERDGHVHIFDGVDELVRFLAGQPPAGKSYVTNGMDGSLVPAEQAIYLRSSAIKTPMGGDIMSFSTRDAGARYVARHKLPTGAWLDHVTAMVATQQEAKRKLKDHAQHMGHDRH